MGNLKFKLLCKNSLRYLGISFLLYFLSIPFIRLPFLRAGTALCLAFLPLLTLRSYSRAKEVQFAREQLKSLLEILCARISSGKSLEPAMMDVKNDLIPIYGKDSIICKALKTFEDRIKAGAAFDEAVPPMSGQIPCPESAPLFFTIAGARNLGNRILPVLRQSLSMVSEFLLVTRDISSDVSEKRLESTIMSAMPFLVLWSLNMTTPSYLDPAFNSVLGSLLMLLAFVLSVVGYCLGGAVIAHSIYNKTRTGTSSQKTSLSMLFSRFYTTLTASHPERIKWLSRLVFFLPENYKLSVKRTLIYLYPGKSNQMEEYLFIKICILFFCFTGYLLLRSFLTIPFLYFLLISAFLVFLHDVDTNGIISRNKAEMMQDFPTFIGLLSTLLSSGVVLSKSLSLCISTFTDSSKPFRDEMELLHRSVASGTPCYEALEVCASRCQLPEIACALLFASQYDKTGSMENLNLLKLQSSSCWAQSKSAARRRLEESSVKLLFPMILQLICVILITVTPSLLSLKGA